MSEPGRWRLTGAWRDVGTGVPCGQQADSQMAEPAKRPPAGIAFNVPSLPYHQSMAQGRKPNHLKETTRMGPSKHLLDCGTRSGCLFGIFFAVALLLGWNAGAHAQG
ncbi:MAG: hypothetical protein ACREDC_02265, partial [Bradyrhizobium sp.]